VKALFFVCASAAYLLIAYFVAIILMGECGMGPDSPIACNDAADRQILSFAVGAIVFYAILSVRYWWPRRHSKG